MRNEYYRSLSVLLLSIFLLALAGCGTTGEMAKEMEITPAAAPDIGIAPAPAPDINNM